MLHKAQTAECYTDPSTDRYVPSQPPASPCPLRCGGGGGGGRAPPVRRGLAREDDLVAQAKRLYSFPTGKLNVFWML